MKTIIYAIMVAILLPFTLNAHSIEPEDKTTVLNGHHPVEWDNQKEPAFEVDFVFYYPDVGDNTWVVCAVALDEKTGKITSHRKFSGKHHESSFWWHVGPDESNIVADQTKYQYGHIVSEVAVAAKLQTGRLYIMKSKPPETWEQLIEICKIATKQFTLAIKQ